MMYPLTCLPCAPDATEPRPLGSGNPGAFARESPLPDGRGSERSGETMTKTDIINHFVKKECRLNS